MADNNNDDDLCHRMEAHERTSKAQQEVLDNNQQMLAQLLTNRNNDNTIGSNYENEENNNNEPLKTEHSKEGSSIDAEVIKGIQAQIASLPQRDELKKVGAVRPYPLEWNSVPYPPKFKPPMLHSYDGKSSPNQHIYYFRSQTGNVVGNDAIMARLFIGTLKGITFDWSGVFPRTPSIPGWTWKPNSSPDSTRMIPR